MMVLLFICHRGGELSLCTAASGSRPTLSPLLRGPEGPSRALLGDVDIADTATAAATTTTTSRLDSILLFTDRVVNEGVIRLVFCEIAVVGERVSACACAQDTTTEEETGEFPRKFSRRGKNTERERSKRKMVAHYRRTTTPQLRSPRRRRASWMSLAMIVSRFAWIEISCVSSKRLTK